VPEADHLGQLASSCAPCAAELSHISIKVTLSGVMPGTPSRDTLTVCADASAAAAGRLKAKYAGPPEAPDSK
jgi:hypothetical protein